MGALVEFVDMLHAGFVFANMLFNQMLFIAHAFSLVEFCDKITPCCQSLP